ncbi:MAG: hypothetical protein MUF72_06545 [Elainella sp. Prado103]|nr:hypothetical protein [Elainella sp. Prado103]
MRCRSRGSIQALLLPGWLSLWGIVGWIMTPPNAVAYEGYGGGLQGADRSDRSRSKHEPPDEFQPGTLGVCHLHNLAGYLAIDGAGRVVPLSQYCQQQRNWVWHHEDDFWEAFRDVASVEVLSYTQTLDRHRVEFYAQSICSFLSHGNPEQPNSRSNAPQMLRQIQSDQQLPSEFERAVTYAATKTYCPQHRMD